MDPSSPSSVSESDSTQVGSPLMGKNDFADEEEETCSCDHSRRRLNRFRNGRQPVTLYILSVLTIALAMNLLFTTWLGIQSRWPESTLQAEPENAFMYTVENFQSTDQDCLRRMTPYTPAVHSIQYHEINFGLEFGNTSKYRGPPTEERQHAWGELWRHEGVMIESWEMLRLNQTDLSRFQKVTPEKGDGYVAWLEMYHQLACLDLIRQYTWLLMGSYPEGLVPEELQKEPEENRRHVDYCIETLRLSLMCHGDTTPLLVTKERNDATGWRSELNTDRKCVNFTKLQEWVEENGVEDWATPGGHGEV